MVYGFGYKADQVYVSTIVWSFIICLSAKILAVVHGHSKKVLK